MKKFKIVINADYGGFRLSRTAIEWLAKRGIYQKYPDLNYIEEIPRHEPLLVQCVETLGAEIAGESQITKLEIREIESATYYIEEYDGKEWILTPSDFIHIPETTENAKQATLLCTDAEQLTARKEK